MIHDLDDDIPLMIDDCLRRYSKLNDWERTFIPSISHQFNLSGRLTQPQIDSLSKIWERVT